MIVFCDECGWKYDDQFRTTICPHDTFAANDGKNNFSHHPESHLSKPNNTTSERFKKLLQKFRDCPEDVFNAAEYYRYVYGSAVIAKVDGGYKALVPKDYIEMFNATMAKKMIDRLGPFAAKKPTLTIRVGYNDAQDAGDKRHAQAIMKDLGIKYEMGIPETIADCWMFYGVDEDTVPKELPPYVEIVGKG